MHEILLSHGYELVDDGWDERGHRTYVHNGKPNREHLVKLEKAMRPAGWARETGSVDEHSIMLEATGAASNAGDRAA